jgi:ABC-type nitrate/sulfonate/bicarbonate transport system substrate-binding protein
MPVTSYAAKLPGDAKIVAMLGQSSHSLLVAKESGVTGPDGLAGRKLGVSFGSDSHLDVLVWVNEQRLAGKLELVNVAPSELATALANNSVDAIVVRQPQVLRLQQQAEARIIKTWPFRFVSIVKTQYIAAHPAALAKYLDSYGVRSPTSPAITTRPQLGSANTSASILPSSSSCPARTPTIRPQNPRTSTSR